MDFRVLVCGGRDYSDRHQVWAVLDELWAKHGDLVIIHGAARGADSLADEWAKENNQKIHMFPAQWKAYGRSAGPKRNQEMLDKGQPQYFVAFPGGKGTADMVRRCRKAGISGIEMKTTEDKDEEAQQNSA